MTSPRIAPLALARVRAARDEYKNAVREAYRVRDEAVTRANAECAMGVAAAQGNLLSAVDEALCVTEVPAPRRHRKKKDVCYDVVVPPASEQSPLGDGVPLSKVLPPLTEADKAVAVAMKAREEKRRARREGA